MWYRLTPSARRHLVAFAHHLLGGLTGKAEFDCRGGGIREANVTTKYGILDLPDNKG